MLSNHYHLSSTLFNFETRFLYRANNLVLDFPIYLFNNFPRGIRKKVEEGRSAETGSKLKNKQQTQPENVNYFVSISIPESINFLSLMHVNSWVLENLKEREEGREGETFGSVFLEAKN